MEQLKTESMNMQRNILIKAFSVCALLLAFYAQGFSQRALMQLSKAPVGGKQTSTVPPRVKVAETTPPAAAEKQVAEEQPQQAATEKPTQRLQLYGKPKAVNRTGKRIALRRVPVEQPAPDDNH